MQSLSKFSPRQYHTTPQLGRRLLVSLLFIVGIAGTPFMAVEAIEAASNACTIVNNPTATNFTNCPNMILDDADFSGGKNLSFANFSGSSLKRADISDATLNDANLSGALLNETDISGATLLRTNLSSANLTDADISFSNLSGANLNGVLWSNTICVDETVSNNNGNTCSGHLLLPTIVANANKANNAPYTAGTWSNQNVTVSFTCTPASGRTIATCTTAQNFSSDGTFTKEGTATDNAGFFSNTSFGPIQLDKTPPTVTANAKKADATAYSAGSWSNQEIIVSFTCSDNGSGLAGACPSAQTITAEGITPAAQGAVADNAGNSTTTTFGPIQIDKTKPTISGVATPTANDNGWHNSNVTVSFTCADNPNGAGLATNTVAGATLSTEGANQTVTNSGLCSDNAGNSADATTVSGINIDKSAPDTTITSQPDDPSPLVATFVFTGTDLLAGVTGFQCSLDGAPFNACAGSQQYNALTAGLHTFHVQALDAAGNLDSTPASFTWTASGDLPVAADQTVTTAEESAVAITLQATGKHALTYHLISEPAHGSLSGAAPDLTYTPTLNFAGIDHFTFRANDGQFNSNLATITINVTPVNDVPVVGQSTLSIAEDTPLAVTLDVTDVDGDVLTYTLLSQPAHGTLAGALPAATYTSVANFNGADGFTFSVSDGATQGARTATVTLTGTVIINVTAVNDAPTATDETIVTLPGVSLPITLRAADVEGDALTYTLVTEPQHGALSGTAPNLVYTPANGFSGADEVSFQANDGQAISAVAKITIKVTDKPFGLFLALISR